MSRHIYSCGSLLISSRRSSRRRSHSSSSPHLLPGSRSATAHRSALAALGGILGGMLGAMLAAGCSGSAPMGPASYPPRTTMALAAARCQSDGTCTCRDEEGAAQGQGEIPAGLKRFELLLPKTTSAIWVEVAGKGVFYKAPEDMRPTCFYLDLPPGEHAVTMQSNLTDVDIGLQTGLKINEHGPSAGPSWYSSLDFSCGGLNKCTKGNLADWVERQRALPRGVLDPCGSVMIRGVQTSGSVEQRLDAEYRDVTLRFVMKIYAFEPNRSPGSAECKAPVKNR